MGYRDREAALLARFEALGRDQAHLMEEKLVLGPRLEAVKRERDASRKRLEQVGTGGGRPDASRDRMGVAAGLLCSLGMVSVFCHLTWNRYIDNDPTVIPAILWLATPGVLAMLVAWPYRATSSKCRVAFGIGAFIAALPLINLWIGAL